jgi:dTDP-4-dehydrorhamnose 3,5-epimerase
MKYISKNIKGLFTITPKIYRDFRGENVETYDEKVYIKMGCPKFVVDSFSFSRKNVLRGFHGDKKTWKMIQCIKGDIYFVVIDVRNNSSTFGNKEVFLLNDKDRLQVIVPAGCVNAHLCLSDECVFSYKLSTTYTEQKDQISVKWNDQKHEIFWPITNPILSERDL